jgi:predicted nucleic acid-binding protein
MNIPLDTNILSRMAQVGHAQHPVAVSAANALVLRGDAPCLLPQALYEFWVVATRPASVNGLGFTVQQAGAELSRLKGLFPLLPDSPAIYPEWERFVTVHQVTGKNAHDARIVAAMTVHGLTHLLTFNPGDFARYPGITALDPATIVLPPGTSSAGT